MAVRLHVPKARSRSRRLFRRGVLALALGALAGSAFPAAAEVRLSREADGDFRIPVMTWWDIPFRSVVRQQFDFSCGSAAVATLLTYHHDRRTAERDSFAWMWEHGNQATISKVGFSMAEMRNYLRSLGYKAEGYRLTIDQLRKTNQPSIALIDFKGYKHFVVIKGMRGDRILVGDSVLGLSEYDVGDFAKMWNGIVLAVVADGESPPRFNVASDWGPWSQAPLEQGSGGIRVAVGDLTTHLPQDYQITPVLLLDVHVGTVR